MYRFIDPADPVSQVEWVKQNAVKRVRAKSAIDRDGNVSSDLPSDTIEIFATFTDDSGFFGLTSYIRYAAEQIFQSHAVIQQSKRLTTNDYRFPWRYVDDSNVDVEGFIKQPFGFEIDQEKILDLLTGHTLYNDSAIVVRELVQNSLDAVRLQAAIEADSSYEGSVNVHWDLARSQLTVSEQA